MDVVCRYQLINIFRRSQATTLKVKASPNVKAVWFKTIVISLQIQALRIHRKIPVSRVVRHPTPLPELLSPFLQLPHPIPHSPFRAKLLQTIKKTFLKIIQKSKNYKDKNGVQECACFPEIFTFYTWTQRNWEFRRHRKWSLNSSISI